MQPLQSSISATLTDREYLDCLIAEGDAAAFLGYSVRALQNWRVRGGGPKFIKVSARSVRYRRRDLIAWSDALLRVHTSDLGDGGARG